ncbi:MAG: SCO family protein [Pseudomonadales bacterium]|nr:SCO family protein [Pseudomonadales bacterium]
MSGGNRKVAIFRYVLVVVLSGAMGFGAYLWQTNREPVAPELEQAFFIEPARPIVWNQLVAHDGSAYTPQNLKGKWSYLYMGYRSCPDACPVALGVLSKVSKRLAELNLSEDQQPQYLFLSVDPARDTPELLAEYVAFFGKRFIGVTGKDIELKAVAAQLGGIFYVPEDPKPENYEVGHSDSIYLMNPEGQLRVISRPPHDKETIVRNHLELLD